MTVGKICSRVVDTAEAGEAISEVARRMRDQNVGSLPVVDDDGRLVGIVTDRDLVVRVLAERLDAPATQVGQVMSECLQTIREDASLETALAAMRQRTTRRLPVVDSEDRFVGILTLDDMLGLLAEEFGAIGSVLAAESRQPARRFVPDEPAASAAPVQRRAAPAAGRSDQPEAPPQLQRTLSEIQEAIDVIALALSVGLETRMLGGGVIEADVRASADRRLRQILARIATPTAV